MNAPNNMRNAQHERAADEWYVEPGWSADLIFQSGMLPAGITVWDPACGMGTMVKAAARAGHPAYGTDAFKRGEGFGDPHDFFRHHDTPRDWLETSDQIAIASNPPFNVALEWALRALSLNLGPVAIIVQLRFLAGLTRAHLYAEYPPAFEAVFSDRPSMPPGEKIDELAGDAFEGGTIDFACIVWNAERTGPTVTRKLYREANFDKVAGRYRAAKGRVATWAAEVD